jgi:hypothetical protein
LGKSGKQTEEAGKDMNVKSRFPDRITQPILFVLQKAGMIIQPGILKQGDQHEQDQYGQQQVNACFYK